MTTRSTGNTAVIRKAFAGLDQEALDKFRTFAVKKTYPPDTVLCAEGETADIFYIVNSGRVVISREVEGAAGYRFRSTAWASRSTGARVRHRRRAL